MGVRCRVGPATVARLRNECHSRHYLLIPHFVHPTLLSLIQESVEHTGFDKVEHGGFGHDLRMKQTSASSSLNFLLNDRHLLSAIEQIFGCGRIGSFTGAVRRAIPGPGNALGWHNDNVGNRIVAITINLGVAPYEGGRLQIRNARSKRVIADVSNTGPGNAVIFPVSAEFEHRNSPVTGTVAKTAFSGWFCNRPNFEELFAARFRSSAPIPLSNERTDTSRKLASITPGATFTVPREIVSRRMGDGTILLNIASGATFALDETGTQIWNLLKLGSSVRVASHAIAARYGAPIPEVRDDTTVLIGQLVAQKLLMPHVRARTN